ncbi:hypothetical protein pdam_00001014 [Pocillopora damicornis]|uniref:Uncharacterized protein n=1 Tax=Pocillopora damicornis TaxID=46731 RepID=A0A3M6T654_POCDA|nr:hypothetical protein pdam_00001014 [Pocillopora damicornis]
MQTTLTCHRCVTNPGTDSPCTAPPALKQTNNSGKGSFPIFFIEENRNLCESEDDKAECIKEIEEAKASPVAEENPEESADSEEEPKEEEKMVPEEDHLVMLERVRKESEENRKFWQEEVLAMNKWRRHWLS